MCAIFGLGFMHGHKVEDSKMVRDIMRNLFIKNQVHGRTAAGLALVSGEDIKVVKKNIPGEVLVTLPEYKVAESKYMSFSTATEEDRKLGISKSPPRALIGHCRLQTKGCATINDNNHPIVRENVVGVHNGMIGNDDHIFNIYSKAFNRNGQVDSEIIFALIDHFSKDDKPIHRAIQKMAMALQGSLACAMTHSMKPWVVWLFRRNGPCDVVVFRDVGMVAWDTNVRHIKEAVESYYNVLGPAEVVEFEPHSGMGIDLHRNIIHRFDMNGYNQSGTALGA